MEITISKKEEDLLKSVLNTTNIQPIVQKHFEDWINFVIDSNYKNLKTKDEKIDEIINKSK